MQYVVKRSDIVKSRGRRHRLNYYFIFFGLTALRSPSFGLQTRPNFYLIFFGHSKHLR